MSLGKLELLPGVERSCRSWLLLDKEPSRIQILFPRKGFFDNKFQSGRERENKRERIKERVRKSEKERERARESD